ncbi:tetratricopeptide repeat protein [Sediminibacterium sp.]|uniref:type IX secretion system periplasmic lipoprotein PorW/SprE n=1 Tax=Sediminibacterium sp. TaxID=1917865 RepID=UPI003F6E834C
MFYFLKKPYHTLLGILLFSCSLLGAQPNTSVTITKPEKYQNRSLPAEKSGNKKFTIPRRLYNNTVSQFNYYYNASEKLKNIIIAAKEQHKEDYTALLPFYNYSLNETAKGQIDSIIYKCTAGILLHDLRSDWVDQFYLLMGNAYMHRKDFDSATQVFNYINYAFAKKEDGYDLPIGSNSSSKSGAFSISTDEKRSLWKKMSSLPPARNESFLLQTRNFIEQGKLEEAESLLQILASDSYFPSRLKTSWNEYNAYLLYNEKQYDSAAFYLIKALPNASNKSETARWEYLIGQLFAISNKDSLSTLFFEKAIQHTNDPLMDIYARLNIVALNADNQKDALNFHLSQLLAMAKKEKFQQYRDLIYYAAAELEIRQKQYKQAEELLKKSIFYNEDNNIQRSKSYYLLSESQYKLKKYIEASNSQDSITTNLLNKAEASNIEIKKEPLKKIALALITINREDSLQKIATLPESDRIIFLKSLLKRLRKEKGIKDTANELSYGSGINNTLPSDLFGGTNSNEGFYFMNNNLKTKGLSDFKAKWGNRPNIDNWRRQSAVDKNFRSINIDNEPPLIKNNTTIAPLSMESLMDSLPLTNEKLQQSNKLIGTSLLNIAMGFQYQLNDFNAAIDTYEILSKRFSESSILEEVWFQLNYCYKKINELNKADSVKQLLTDFYPKGKKNQLLQTGVEVKSENNNQLYATIYNQFIEGKFEEAIANKNKADAKLGNSYWSPQLIYIESIYYIKQKQDSIAKLRLATISSLFPTSPIAEKAKTMLDVLNKRAEIETYLTNLSIERPIENEDRKVDLNTIQSEQIPIIVKAPTTIKVPEKVTPTAPIISSTIERKVLPDEYSFNVADSQYVAIALYKVDPVFVNEAKNAFNRFNQDRYYGQKLPITVIRINEGEQLLLMGPFANATEASTYTDKNKGLAATRIIPWLTPDKYSFSIISPSNLTILKKKGETVDYWKLLKNLFPDKY